jgi:hypothetical protein
MPSLSGAEIGPGGAGRDKNRAEPEEFTGLRQLAGNTRRVEQGAVRPGVLGPGSIRRQTVFVDDMKEVAHAAGLGGGIAGFQ